MDDRSSIRVDGPAVVRLPPPEPVHEVITMLRDLLKRAEAGEIRAIAIAAHVDAKCTASAYELGDGDIAHLVCAIERVKLRLLEAE